MSTIKTLSSFYFVERVTVSNRSIDFDEGGGELQATLNTGSYTPTEYAAEWQRALRAAGTQAYVVSFNRSTRELTVSAPLAFDLLSLTGSRAGTGAWESAGFSILADHTGLNSYTSDDPCGDIYEPQYILSDYTAAKDSLIKESATVNETPAGIVQQISYGDGARIKMNIRVITNKTGLKNENFFENVNGEDDARAFMAYLLGKNKVEFMPDKATPNAFEKVYLVRTAEDGTGREFELKNMKFPDFYETGNLVFRKVLA